MTEYLANHWSLIAAFYKKHNPAILASPRNEWAIDPYAWDTPQPMIFMTPIEEAFWADVRQIGAVLYPQYPVAGVFLDFANPIAKVAVECDGAQFHKDKTKDADRDAMLASRGWTIYRLTGRECRQDFNEVTRELSAPAKLVQKLIQRHGIGAI